MLDTACAGVGNELHVCLRKNDGRFFHAIRRPDRSWVGFNDASGIGLNDLDIGGCWLGQTTAEQDRLFGNRNNVGANEVVVYFVRSTDPPTNGCATHPAGRPGAVVTRGATRWTLAHEVGHVLGLSHADDPPPPNPFAPPALLDRLMTGRGTSNITNPPPDLVATEIGTMRASALTPRC